MTKNIQLQLTEVNARMIRDAIMDSVNKECNYRKDLKRFHNIESIKNLLEVSERQEDQLRRLGDLFHNVLVLTKWQD